MGAGGTLRHYVELMRPRFFLSATVFPLTGYAVSPDKPASAAGVAADLAILLVAYGVLGSGGNFAFNSAFDRDEGPVGFLERPPAPPPRLAAFGLACMALGTAVFALRGPAPALLAASQGLLSIVYSRPTAGLPRLKDIPGVDAALNAVGAGVLPVLTGCALTGTGALGSTAVLGAGAAFSLSFLAGYPAWQIFQLEPRERYDRPTNYASLVGPRRVLVASAACMVLAWATLAATVDRDVVVGAPASLRKALGFGALTALYAACAAVFARWSRRPFDAPKARVYRFFALVMAARGFWIVGHW